MQERPEPGLIRCRTDAQELGKEAVDLLSKLAAEAVNRLAEILFDATELSELDDRTIIDFHAMKAVAVGSEGIGQHEGIAAIILGPGHGAPVSEAIELLGVDVVDMSPAFHEGFDHSPTWDFDGDRDASEVLRRKLLQPRRQLGESLVTMRNGSLSEELSVGIANADLMSLGCPIDTDVEIIR